MIHLICNLTLLMVIGFTGCRNGAMVERTSLGSEAAARHDQWSQPVDIPGVPNARRVGPGLYRGGQPSRAGFESLQQLGVKTVINLRGNDSNRHAIQPGQFNSLRIPMDGFHPQVEQVIEFLRIASDDEAQPIFLHCQHGADRTGVLIAMHRVVMQGWTREQAVAEMTRGGTRFHSLYGNLADFVREADVEAIRRELGTSAMVSRQ